MFVKPAEGLQIPDPAMAGTPDYYLPAEGREVQDSDYWTRRVRDGDVLEVKADGVDAQAVEVVASPPLPATKGSKGG